jgi:3-hydroxyacyl-CoA dehydrogenase
MAEGLSAGFRAHFAGIHLYNPPHVMTGTELIPHPEMPAGTVKALSQALTERFGRQIVLCADTPAFAGNRIGFKVLNEVAKLALQHGVQAMDVLVGPYTGRALPPLATIDLVGWDVHKAIVDNVHALVRDEAADSFAIPAYMDSLIHRGHLGDKTPMLGGFYRRIREDGRLRVEVLDPASGTYKPEQPNLTYSFVEEVRDLNRRGRYREAMSRFMDAKGDEADLARRVVLGYVSYALNRIGEGQLVARAEDVDRIMSTGFHWVPPSALVDIIGVERTLGLIDRYQLSPPELLKAAARGDVPTPLCTLPNLSAGRYLSG